MKFEFSLRSILFKCLYFLVPLFFVFNATLAQSEREYLPKPEVVFTPKYKPEYKNGFCVLHMPYASSEISNPDDWSFYQDHGEIIEVEIVFTQYPKKKEDWLTNYDTLLMNRLRQVGKLIPEIWEQENINWKLVLQTQCETDLEAQKMFHGVVVKFKPVLSDHHRKAFKNIYRIIKGDLAFSDSTAYKIFERHPKWDSMLVVSDWTGSMYAYGAQMVLWYRMQYPKQRILNFIFFNDGNQLPDRKKVIGETGGIYTCAGNNLNSIVNTMKQVMFNGHGGDQPENDLEALIEAQNNNEFHHLILIADNHSRVRDIELLPQLKHPISIILCGLNEGDLVHQDYLKIASSTNGSIHAINEDLDFSSLNLQVSDTISFMEKKYLIRKGDLMPIP